MTFAQVQHFPLSSIPQLIVGLCKLKLLPAAALPAPQCCNLQEQVMKQAPEQLDIMPVCMCLAISQSL